jgi:hypothetical protein
MMGVVIVLNKKKRSLACEQMDLGAVVLSYTPYMTCELLLPILDGMIQTR